MRRTVPVKLDVDSDDAALLHETVEEFLWVANYVIDHVFDGEYVETSKTTLHQDTYDKIRDRTRLHWKSKGAIMNDQWVTLCVSPRIHQFVVPNS